MTLGNSKPEHSDKKSYKVKSKF